LRFRADIKQIRGIWLYLCNKLYARPWMGHLKYIFLKFTAEYCASCDFSGFCVSRFRMPIEKRTNKLAAIFEIRISSWRGGANEIQTDRLEVPRRTENAQPKPKVQLTIADQQRCAAVLSVNGAENHYHPALIPRKKIFIVWIQ